MKERPILFSASMIRAILEGRKTQTRRPVKPQPEMMGSGGAWRWDGRKGSFRGSMGTHIESFPDGARHYCPYGHPGDRLWVRENIAFDKGYDGIRPVDIPHEAPGIKRFYMADGLKPKWAGQIRPSIHMPRACSRILLEITSVRAERLQEISDEDAQAEGVNAEFGNRHIIPFNRLWVSINGAASWNDNPWVWVVEFKKI